MQAQTITIFQTGRLGDLWFTAPLAWNFHQQGLTVEVAYNSKLGNPFTFFPYIKPVPLHLKEWLPGPRFGYGLNEMIWQPYALLKLRLQKRHVIWNQIFPYRLLSSLHKKKPFVECWYSKYPEVNFRRAMCNLDPISGNTILVFTESQSIRFKKDKNYYDWIYRNLNRTAKATGLRPVVVAYGNQPDSSEYETWRGSLEDYQRLIAGCGLVFGISTSAHVLGQLLGKPTILLYEQGQHPLGRIGDETLYIEQGSDLPSEEIIRNRIAKASRWMPGS